MKLKKIVTFILAGMLMAASMTAASAQERVLDGTIDYDLGEQAEGEYGIMLIDEGDFFEIPTYLNISGEIAEIEKTEDGAVERVLVDKGEGEEVALVVSEETVLIDEAGMPIDITALEVGADIYATQSMAQTMSLPPQSKALAIVLTTENAQSPKYLEIKSIVEEEGRTVLASADGQYLIALSEETEFAPYKTRNIVTAADIKEGSKIFVWYGMSTKSIPEQATASKIMILPVTAEISEGEKDAAIKGAKINDVEIDFAKYGNILPTVEDGVVYLPVRAIAEAAGAEVIWDGQTGTIAIVSAESKAELKIGSEKAIVDGEEVTLAAAPKIVDDRTVVGVSVDLEKYGLKFITE